MSFFMEIHCTLSEDQVLNRLRQGSIGPYRFGAFSQEGDDQEWGGEWSDGVFNISPLDNEHRDELQQRFNLPRTLKTKIWITTDHMYEGQTAVYHMTAILLKEWPGDLAVLLNGDHLRVQRINGQISLRDDCLNPERLVFYQDFDWQPLPRGDE